MVSCCVLQCPNRSETINKASGNVSYHRFPIDRNFKKKWTDATGRRNWVPTKTSTICSEHFVANDYVYKSRTSRFLTGTAVPSQNIYRIQTSNNSMPNIILNPPPSTSKEYTTITSNIAPEATTHSKVMNKKNNKVMNIVHGTTISDVKPVSEVINKVNVRGSVIPGLQVFASNKGDTKAPADPLNITLEDVKPLVACRACLVTAAEQPLRLLDDKLADAYGLMVSPVHHPDIYPKYICTYCRALLLKFVSFRKKCLMTQSTLSEMHDIMSVPITLDVLTTHIKKNAYPLQTMNVQIVSYQPTHKKTKENVGRFGKRSATGAIAEIPELKKQKQPVSQPRDHVQPSQLVKPCTMPISQPNLNEECSQNLLKIELDPEHPEDNIEYLEDIDMDDIINDIKPDKESVSEINEYCVGDLKRPKTKSATTAAKATKVKSIRVLKCMTIQMDSTGLEIGVGNWNKTVTYDKKIETLKCAVNEPVINEPVNEPVINERQDVLPETEFYKTYQVKKEELTKEQQIQQMQDRKNSVNYLRSKYKCNLCYIGFHSAFAFNNHSENHKLVEGNVLCDVCSWSVNKKKMTAHIRNRHRYNYTCNICGHISKELEYTKRHYEWHRGMKYKCKLCDESFSKNTSVYGHMVLKHKDSLISCVICDTKCFGRKGLQFHMSRSHKEAKYAKCLSCSVQFFSRDAMLRHQQASDVHSELSSRPCNACGEGFPSEHLLAKHQMLCPSLKKSQTFTCDVCNKDHDSLLKLRRHSATKCTTVYQRHTYNRKLIDKINKDRKKKNKKPISINKRERDKQRVFMCETCGCTKKTKEQVEIHIRIHHTKEQSFQCDYCGKIFYYKNSLQNHIMNHMGVAGTLTCKYCGKIFTEKTNRYRHETTVHEGLRYKCDTCGATFTTKKAMQDHVRHTHEGVPWPKRVRNRRAERARAAQRTQ